MVHAYSIAISSNPFGEKQEPRIVKAEELPKTMSIPPGTRASQKLPLSGALILTRIAYEKEYVFTVRTEDGHECWFQGLDAGDVCGWVQLLSAVAASGPQRGSHRTKEITPEPAKVVKPADPGSSFLSNTD